jgi:hypothetical protein
MSGNQNYFTLASDFDASATITREPSGDPFGDSSYCGCSQDNS